MKADVEWHERASIRTAGKRVTRGCVQSTLAAAAADVAESPRHVSLFRDWYAGRKFGEYAIRTGEAGRLIASHEAVAYLYEATGAARNADELWKTLDR